jgi:negative regulator of flagellin synthesis FlgM
MIASLGQFDPAKTKPRATTENVAAASGTSRTLATPGAVHTTAAPLSTSNTVLRLAAEGAPIDHKLVDEIRSAIAQGRYPLDPSKVAAAMIAIDLVPAR